VDVTAKLLLSALAAALALAVAAGCSKDDPRPIVRAAEPQPPRRVIAPPAGTTVRPLPPYAIRADGVGPYRLGEKVSAVMAQLPSGPRIARFEIRGVVSTSVIRAEEDTVLIGGETTSTATFVAVVGAEVARTESGVHVGSTIGELTRALGPLVDDPEHARDPRLVAPAGLRNARVVLDGERIAAIAVTAQDSSPVKLGPQPEPVCKRPEPAAGKKQLGACLTGGATGELIEVGEDELIVHPPDSERVLYTLRAAGVVFAAPLRNPADGRDELVVVTRAEESHRRTWALAAYRFEGPRIVRVVDEELYGLTAMQSRWIGAELRDVDLYLELESGPEGIEIGGLLTTRAGERVRDVALLSPKTVTRRHHKGAPGEPQDGKTAATGAPGAGGRPE
jgi:hypothetical protein